MIHSYQTKATLNLDKTNIRQNKIKNHMEHNKNQNISISSCTCHNFFPKLCHTKIEHYKIRESNSPK